jgi:hypothetical protein
VKVFHGAVTNSVVQLMNCMLELEGKAFFCFTSGTIYLMKNLSFLRNVLQIFALVAFKAQNATQILKGINSFTHSVTILAPSVWDSSNRLEPPKSLPSLNNRFKALQYIHMFRELLIN